jgi:predicted PurR-regulated permease PerM
MSGLPDSSGVRASFSSDVCAPQGSRESTHGILKLLAGLLLIGFIAALWFIFHPFVTPLLWAIVMTTATWPAYLHLRHTLPSPLYLAPLVATFILGIIFLLVVLPLPLQLTLELRKIAESLQELNLIQIQETFGSIPVVGSLLVETLTPLLQESSALGALFEAYPAKMLSFAGSAARGIALTLGNLLASLIGCYALYRHGERLLGQLNSALLNVGGEKVPKVLETVHPTVRGAAYGVVATSVSQGILATMGYYFSGAPIPLLLGAVTMITALAPWGAPLVYLPVATYLLVFTSLPWYYGIGLAIWGVSVVSTIDNLLRPLFISQTTSLSPILVFIGVIGGILSFGLLGIFVGPALIAIAQLLWLDLAKPVEQKAP